jgi:hypothetical protein
MCRPRCPHHQNPSFYTLIVYSPPSFYAVNVFLTLFTSSTHVQDLLTNPNPKSPAQREAYEAYERDRNLYNRKVREQAARCAPDT